MKKIALLISIALSSISGGCSMQVGEAEFACDNSSKGATCSSARQIHDLTNSRTNLEGLNVSGGKIIPVEQDEDSEEEKPQTPKTPLVEAQYSSNNVYKPLSNKRYDTMPEAELITDPVNRTFGAVSGVEDEHGKLMVQRESPMALAPEPLAVLQMPKTMRILISSWTDKQGALHMPGFVYVEVAPKKWLVGEQANDRPGRIVPLQIQQVTQEEERRQSRSKQGYSSLGVSEKQGGQ